MASEASSTTSTGGTGVGVAGEGDRRHGAPGPFARVQTIFFDAGNTLLGPHPSFVGRFLAVAQGCGETFDPRLVKVALAGAAAEAVWPMDWTDAVLQREFWRQYYLRVLLEIESNADPSSHVHGAAWRQDLAAALCRSFGDPGAYRVFPDTRSVLDRLVERGYGLGLISNFEPWLLEVLQREGIATYFSSLVISGIEGIAKPMPAMFHLALERARAAAGSSLHVGDHVVEDVEAAQSVGMSAVLVDRAGRPDVRRRARALGVPVLNDLDGLVALLDDRTFGMNVAQ